MIDITNLSMDTVRAVADSAAKDAQKEAVTLAKLRAIHNEIERLELEAKQLADELVYQREES